MRRSRLSALLILLATPAAAQDRLGYDRGGQFEGLAADHSSSGDNGATRVGHAQGGSGAASWSAVPFTSPRSTGIFEQHTTDNWKDLFAEKAPER